MTISLTSALKIARTQVGQLYRNGPKQYAYNTLDADRDCWIIGISQPYAAARRSRADAIWLRAMLAQGVNYDDAYRSIYA